MPEVTRVGSIDPTQLTPAEGPLERGLLWSLTTGQLALSVVFGAIPSVLLALQVEDAVGDDRKAGVLAVVTTLGALATMLTHPVAGLLSDRTRTRWGSRTPWMLGGTAAAVPIIWGMGLTSSVAVLAVLFVLSEIALSCAQVALGAVLPDRVRPSARGMFSAAMGMGVMIGTVAGQAFGSILSGNYVVAYGVLGVLPLALVSLRLVLGPDVDNSTLARPASTGRDVRALLGGFKISPREHPDFWWAFASRLLTYTGFFTVYGYTLYILADYVGLGDDAVDTVPVFALLAAVSVLVTTVPSGLLSDRLGRRKIFVLVSSTGMGLGFAIPTVSDSLAAVLVMAVIAGLAFGCYQAVDQALISEVLPRSLSYAQDLGVVNVASVLPQVLAPAIAGAIVVGTGGYLALFPAAAVLAALGGLAILPVRAVR